jgi:hypothetical protein
MDAQVVASQGDPAKSSPFGINSDILKVKCSVKTCSTKVLRTTTKFLDINLHTPLHEIVGGG